MDLIRACRSRLTYDRASWLLLAALALLVAVTFPHYGVTFDEEVQDIYGRSILSWYATLGHDRTAVQFEDLFYYGGLFDMLAAALNSLSPFGHWETRHLLGGVFGIIGMIGVMRLGRRLGGPQGGFLALALVALIPSYYGMMFINPKDIPFATGMIWSIYYITRIVAQMPRPSRAVILKMGLVAGLTLGIRVGGLLALAYLAATIAAYAVQQAKFSPLAILRIGFDGFWRIFLPVTAIAWVVMLSAWPWAQTNPVLHPWLAFQHFAHMESGIETLYFGVDVGSDYKPRGYLPVYLSLKLPDLVLGLLGFGAVAGLVHLARSRSLPVTWVPALLGALFPILYVLVSRPELYDAERHFLFLLPPLAVLAALAAHHLLTLSQKRGPAVAAVAVLLLAMGAGVQIAADIDLHPYEYAFFNDLIGGVAGARGQFETEYWGESLGEASRILAGFLEENDQIQEGKVYTVEVCGNAVSAAYAFPPFLTVAPEGSQADFYISITRNKCDQSKDGKMIGTVERDGVPFAVVKDLRDEQMRYMASRRRTAPLIP